MIENIMYTLCLLLSTPYDKLNLLNRNNNYFANTIVEEIYLKKLFKFKRRKTLNSEFRNFNYNYTYDIIESNMNFTKIKLNLKTSFIIKDFSRDISSACINRYIIILEHFHDKSKLQLIIEYEENPDLYNYVLKTDLSNAVSLILLFRQSIKRNETFLFNAPQNNFITSNFTARTSIHNRRDSNFNITKACNYAETFALKPNPDYKSFEGIGGDCTNFISQILYAGGFSQTKTWQPYTNPWVRVEELYTYLTSQNLGTKLTDDTFLDRGCLIQFYTPSIGKYFHNGFITYKLQNNDCLYCCHSYNKLNYPLSEIYPNRYPKLRALKFD